MKIRNKNSYAYALTYTAFAYLAAAAPLHAGGNDPIKNQEEGSDKVPVTVNYAENVAQRIRDGFGVAKFDTDKINAKIDKIIDTKGAKEGWTFDIIGSLKVKAKRKIKEKLIEALKKYNAEVDARGEAVATAMKNAINGPSPDLYEKGIYVYTVGERDPGKPGWGEANNDIEGFDDVKGSLNLSIKIPVKLEVSVGVGENKIGISTDFEFGISGSATFNADLQPKGKLTIASPNRPSTLISRDVRLNVGGAAKITGTAGFQDLQGEINLSGGHTISGLKLSWEAKPLSASP